MLVGHAGRPVRGVEPDTFKGLFGQLFRDGAVEAHELVQALMVCLPLHAPQQHDACRREARS